MDIDFGLLGHAALCGYYRYAPLSFSHLIARPHGDCGLALDYLSRVLLMAALSVPPHWTPPVLG
jgi:hypothetical protein